MVLQLIGRLLNISMIRGSIDYLNPTVMQHKQVYTHASTLYPWPYLNQSTSSTSRNTGSWISETGTCGIEEDGILKSFTVVG